MSLPQIPASGRYSRKLKASILAAIDAGVVSDAKARSRYQISKDELAQWKTALGVCPEPRKNITETWSLNRRGKLIPTRIFEHVGAA